MFSLIRKAGRKAADQGATAVEYGLLVAAIAAVIVAVVFGLGTVIQGVFKGTNDCITSQGKPVSAGTDANGNPITKNC